jgi:streptogramin lyase
MAATGTALALLVAAAPASAVTITEYPTGSPATHEPRYLKAGPDGNLWYAEGGTEGGIVRVSTNGEVTRRLGQPKGEVDLSFSPNGTLFWAGEFSRGKLLPNGMIEERPAESGYASFVSPGGEWRWTEKDGSPIPPKESWCTPNGGGTHCADGPSGGRITGLAVDGSNHWWGAYYEDNTLHEMTEPEQVIELPENSGPSRIVLGPDGALWVTMYNADAVDRIAPDGSRVRVHLPLGSLPNEIAVGPEGALWITEYSQTGGILRLTLSGVATEYAIPTPNAWPYGIARGPDGALWFTESKTGKIGRLVPDPLPSGGPAGGGPGGGPGGGGGGTVATIAVPRFTHAPAFQPSRFRSPASHHSSTLQKGSVLTFRLSEAATLKLAVAIPLPGRRVRGKCVAPKKSNRGKPRCTRYVSVGALTANAVAGANRIPFAGRVAGHALKAGTYRTTIVATDAAGNSSAPATAVFTIAP